MSLTEEGVRRLRAEYPGITVLANADASAASMTWRQGMLAWLRGGEAPVPTWSGRVLAVRVTVEGIRGGRSAARCAYDLIVETSNLAGPIPTVWVASPSDQQIRHVNIWPAHKSFCRWAGVNLPSFCWNTFATAWSAAPPRSRTLGAALEYAKQLLNTENHDSPAR